MTTRTNATWSTNCLEPLGFTVIAARSGPECLAILESARPDLVLLDVAMPEMDGWTVGRTIRERRPDRLPIVMLSAFAPDPGLKSEADPVQDHYLIKPVDLRQLLGSIHTLLDIEWIYEGPPTSASADKAAPTRPTVIPPLEDIEMLLQFGRIGYMRGIHDKLNTIEQRSSEYRGFAAYMRVFTDGFDLKRYIAALELFRSEHGKQGTA